MWVIIILMLSTLGATEKRIVNFIQDVIHFSFDSKYCLKYIGSNKYVEEALTSSKIAMVNFNQKFIENGKINLCTTNNYILALDDYQETKNYFVGDGAFPPHSRVLIFSETGNFFGVPFRYFVDWKAVDLIAVFGNWYTLNGLNTTSRVEMEVVSVKNNRTLGFFNDTTANLNADDFKYEKWVPNFGSKRFCIAVFHSPPFLLVDDNKGIYDGLDHYILKFIIEEINKWPVQYKYYKHLAWSRTMKDVADGNCDLAAGGHFDSNIRDVNLDPTTQYLQVCGNFIIPKPDFLPSETFIFQSIHNEGWILIICLIIITSIIINLFTIYYQRIRRMKSVKYYENLLLVLKIVVMQPAGKNSKYLSLNIVILSWVYASLLVTNMYSAGYTSRLTKPRFSRGIDTFGDMVQHNIRCYDSGVYTTSILEQSDDINIRKVGKLMVSNHSLQNIPENSCLLCNVINGKYVFPETDYYDYTRLDMTVLPECFSHFFMSYALQKNSPYKKILDHWLTWSFDYGFVKAWLRAVMSKPTSTEKFMKHFFLKALTTENVEDLKLPISMLEIQAVTYILFIGYFLALLAFVYEKIAADR